MLVIKGCGAVILTDNTGTALTASTSMTSWYKVVATADGATTKYAYINTTQNGAGKIIPNGDSLHQANIRVVADASVQVVFAFQMNVKDLAADADNWQPLPAYDATFAAGGASQKINTIYQQDEAIFDTPCRVLITTNGAANVWVQVTTS